MPAKVLSDRIDQAATTYWLKVHGRGEKRLSDRIAAFLNEQTERAAQETELGLTQATALIDPEIESEKMLRSIHPELLRLMVIGAKSELDRFEDRKAAGDEFSFDIPDDTMAAIRQSLQELEAQPFWQTIQRETQERLAEIINAGIHDGLSNHGISMEIREHLGGFEARKRAKRIARTESTGSLNAGHQAAYDRLADSGLITGKKWLTIGDNDVRREHVTLNRSVVDASGEFIVGGSPAPYPGHLSLPAGQRVNCRCLTVAEIIE